MSNYLFLSLLSSLSFYSCLFLIQFGINAVLASAMTGLLGSFLDSKRSHISSIIYCASFAAIGAVSISNNNFFLLLIPLFVSSLFYALKDKFIGWGGKLGAIAFAATGFFFIIVRMI